MQSVTRTYHRNRSLISKYPAIALTLIFLFQSLQAAPDNTPAHFRVTSEIVKADVRPFTATINGIGNTLMKQGAGFEPIVFRTKYMVTKDAPNRVVADPAQISYWDTLRQGALDGADVRVYRVVNGRMRLVREDRIAEGGFNASGWVPLTEEGKVLPSDRRQYSFRWDPWNRPNADYYFTVRAVDHSGNYSRPANAIAIKSPKKISQGKVFNKETQYRKSRLTLDSTAPAAPKNLRGLLSSGGKLTLIWDPPDDWDVAGYVVYRSDYPVDQHKGHYLQLEGIADTPDQYIKTGDMVIVGKKFYRASRDRFFTKRVWGSYDEYSVLQQRMLNFFSDEAPKKKSWQLVKHSAGTAVEEPGETYLRVKLGFGEKAFVGLYNHSGTGQQWYDVLKKGERYNIDVWLRKEGIGRIKFVSDGDGHGIKPEYLRADDKWRKFQMNFVPWATDSSADPRQMRLELTGPGTFSIDNFRVYQSGSRFLDLLPQQYRRIRESGMSTLRTHGLIKTERRTYDIEQLTNPGGVISGTARLNTLPQTLTVMEKAGVHPWLQIEPHLSPKEWLALVEYLAAPYDPVRDTPDSKPWANKRYHQGRKQPWVKSFDKIYFELGNETWNTLFAPWVFEDMPDKATGRKYGRGEVYGLYQEYIISILRSSPYWQAAGLDGKFDFVIGGWSGQDYGQKAASLSPSSQHLTIAAYNGGWDEAEGPPKLNKQSFFNLLNQVSQSAIPVADQLVRETDGIGRVSGRTPLLGTYEAGPGYVLNGLNGAEVTPKQAEQQEQVMKSLAAGTATLDAFLARAYRGFQLQNFFTFAEGDYWKSHAKWYKGGQAYPSWQLLSLFNREGTGNLLKTKTLSVPTTSLKKFDRRKAVAAAPLVSAYASSQGDRFNLFLLSRKIPNYPKPGDNGYIPVTVDLPFVSAQKLTLHRMSGNPMANNVAADNVKVEKVSLSSAGVGGRLKLSSKTGADNRGLPPAAAYLYVFEGVSSQ